MFDSYKSIFRHRHPHEGWKWTWKYFSQWFSLEFEEDYIQYWNIIYDYFFFFGSSWNSYLVAPALKFNGWTTSTDSHRLNGSLRLELFIFIVRVKIWEAGPSVNQAQEPTSQSWVQSSTCRNAAAQLRVVLNSFSAHQRPAVWSSHWN